MTGTKIRLGASLILVLSSFAYGNPSEFDDQATASLLKGDWKEVVQTAKRWKEHESNNSVARWLLGHAGLATADYRLATDSFANLGKVEASKPILEWTGSLVQRHPNNAIARMVHGDALARSAKYAEALATLDEAVRVDQHSALVYNVRGVVKALMGKFDEAMADLEKAVEIQSNFADAHVNLGLVRLQRDDLDGAMEALNRAIEIAPDFPIAFNARGGVFLALEALDEAQSDFEQARKLAPRLAFTAGNLAIAERARSEVSFRLMLSENDADKRGSTLIAQSYEHRALDIGGGRTMDYVVIKSTPQTSSLEGMRTVMADVLHSIRTQSGLPEEWRPKNVIVAVHGMGSGPYAEMTHVVRVGQHAGADLVVGLDLRPWFQWHKAAFESAFSEATNFGALANAAINLEWRVVPSAIANSQGVRMVAVKMGELYEAGRLAPEVAQSLRWKELVLMGASLQNMKVPSRYEAERIGAILNFTTPSLQPFISSQPLSGAKVLNVQMNDLGRSVAHTKWNDDLWHNRPNPVPEIAGWFIHGVRSPEIVQAYAHHLGEMGRVPLYSTPSDRPLQDALTIATLAARTLRPSDKVLIGGIDTQRIEVISQVFTRGGLQVERQSETDGVKLQSMGAAGGFARIIAVSAIKSDPISSALLKTASTAYAAPLPVLRSLAENMDRLNQGLSLAYKLTGGTMPIELKGSLAFTSSALKDLADARMGQLNPWTSNTLERVGTFGLKELPRLADSLIEKGKLPTSYKNFVGMAVGLPDFVAGAASQVGRRSATPTVDELTHYLDGINKAAWAAVGYLAGGTRGASVGGTAGGLAADILRGATEPLFQKVANIPVQKQAIENWRHQMDAAIAYGAPIKTFSEMYTPQHVKQIGVSAKTVTELDNLARWANTTRPLTGNASSSSSLDSLRTPIPGMATTIHDDMWKRPFLLPPPRFDPTPVTNFRLPSSVLPGDKRGGVALKADVVKGKPADTSDFFGGGSSDKPKGISQQQALLCPFLLFCALWSEK